MKKTIFRAKTKLIKDGSRVFILPGKNTIYVVDKGKISFICNPKIDKDLDNLFEMLYKYIINKKVNFFVLN